MASTNLTEGPLPAHIKKIALPMSVGYFFNTMYNVVDSFYAGRVSTDALAALALSFPIFFIIIAVSGGLSRGASALIANAIGAKDEALEMSLTGQVYSLAVLASAVLTAIGLSVAAPLFELMGASGDYLHIATKYITPLYLGCIFFILSNVSNAVLLAHGDSKTYSKVLVGGFFANLILNPWFLYGGFGLPAMGVAGIAWATVWIQVIGTLYLIFTIIKRGHIHLRCLHHLKPTWNVCRQILKQGIPTSFNLMSIALGFFVTTYFLKYYGEHAIAAFGVGTRIEQMALLPAIGLGAAIVSIVGQNNGAGEIQRVRECVRLCLRYGVYLIVSASLLLVLFARPLVGLFTEDAQVLEIGVHYVRIVACIQWAYVVGFVYIGFLQAIKRPMYGFTESITRKIILPIIVFSVAVFQANVSLTSFWIAGCIINALVAVITILYAERELRRLS